MRKGIGIVGIVIGVLLIVKGQEVANSVASQVKEILTGAPVSQAMNLYLAGIGLGLLGLLLVFWKKK
jgi:drug/metabolite transporter (DMT)-like permease